jgi:hypothetical protein
MGKWCTLFFLKISLATLSLSSGAAVMTFFVMIEDKGSFIISERCLFYAKDREPEGAITLQGSKL